MVQIVPEPARPFSGHARPNNEVPRKAPRLGLAPFLSRCPPHQEGPVVFHDCPGIRGANEGAAPPPVPQAADQAKSGWLAPIRWSALQLANQSSVVGVTTIRRPELAENETKFTRVNDQAIRRTLEAAGGRIHRCQWRGTAGPAFAQRFIDEAANKVP